jgi:hypothetical protein
VDTGLDSVEEGQCFDTAACGEFDLLRRAFGVVLLYIGVKETFLRKK